MPQASTKFKFFRAKTEKWGRLIFYAGYVILALNLFSLAMTLLNIAGVFTAGDSYFGQNTVFESREKQKEFFRETEARNDISADQKFYLEAEEEMEEQNERLHDFILTPH